MGSGDVCPDVLVTVGAFFIRSRRRRGGLCLDGVAGRPPTGQSTTQRPRLPALVPKELRHTGAGPLLGSRAVRDDLRARRQARKLLQDFASRPRRA